MLNFLRSQRSAIWLALLWLFAMSAFAEAPGRPHIQVPRVTTAPVLDGHLNEPVWQSAALLDQFVQTEPDEGQPPSQATEVRLMLDSRFLYLGVRCHDREPQRIVATQRQRDSDLSIDDSIGFVLDTFDSHRQAYYFATNPLGTQTDGLLSSADLTLEWDGDWQVATQIDAGGWTAEIAIPLRSLNFDPGQDTWGFNLERDIARRMEAQRWTAPRRHQGITWLDELGALDGMAGLSSDHPARVEAHGLLHASRTPAGLATDWNVGADLYYQPTPQSTLALTYHTDFAEADVDQRVVNLTRYPITLPEKRGFFLQDAHYFHFADAMPFYSRRIGLDAQGQALSLNGGAKLTGRKGNWSYGVLLVESEASSTQDSKLFVVGRAQASLGTSSSLGLIYTQGNPQGTGDNRLAGVDMLFKSAPDNQHQSDTLHLYALQSHDVTNSAVLSGRAIGLNYAHSDSQWEGAASYSRNDRNFNPALGFAIAGVSDLSMSLSRSWSPPGWQLIRLSSQLSQRSNLDGQRLDFTLVPGALSLQPRSLHTFSYSPSMHRDFYVDPYSLQPGMDISVGAHAYWRHDFRWISPKADVLSTDLAFSTGGYPDGSLQTWSASLVWRPSDKLSLYPNWQRNDYRVANQRFMLRVSQVTATLAWSSEGNLNLVAQHDDASHTLLITARLRQRLGPDCELLFVLGRNHDPTPGPLQGSRDDAIVKVKWHGVW